MSRIFGSDDIECSRVLPAFDQGSIIEAERPSCHLAGLQFPAILSGQFFHSREILEGDWFVGNKDSLVRNKL